MDKIELGEVVVQKNLANEIDKTVPKSRLIEFLRRHKRGDWGDVSLAERKINEQAVIDGDRILSSYKISDDKKIWIITEADRKCTTLLFPEDY